MMKNIWPKEWQFTELQNIATATSGCAYPVVEYPTDDLNAVHTIDKITDTEYTLSDTKYMRISDRELMKFRLRAGDLIFCHRNSPRQIGKSVMFQSEESVIHTSKFLRIRVTEQYDSKFLEYVFCRYRDAGQFNRMANQNQNLRSITLHQLNELPVPDLSIEQQRHILENIYADDESIAF